MSQSFCSVCKLSTPFLTFGKPEKLIGAVVNLTAICTELAYGAATLLINPITAQRGISAEPFQSSNDLG